MYRRVLAFDYDGTIAEHGMIPPVLLDALGRVHASGCPLFLVTGRRFESMDLGEAKELFTGIVWENGAVLSHTASGEIYLPFGHVEPRVADDLRNAGVALEEGVAIIATWLQHEETVWHTLSRSGVDAVVAHNKGALMILPPGTAKGAGLSRLLELCGYSPRNLVAFGDAENDLSLLEIAEVGIAVGDSVPSLRAAADVVVERPGPAGVLETLERFWLAGRGPAVAAEHEKKILVGDDRTGTQVFLSAADLATGGLGIFGDSGSGKSWLAGLLVEGMHHAGYQVLLIDPEGDYRGMRALPRMVAVGGGGDLPPQPSLVTTLLASAGISVVLDLSSAPMNERKLYVTELFHALRPLRRNTFRPHWTVIEEAQHFLPRHDPAALSLAPMLAAGGYALVSYRPDRIAASALEGLDRTAFTRTKSAEAAECMRSIMAVPSARTLRETPSGHAWLCDGGLIRLRPAMRHVPHIRHLYKYLDTPLPRYKRFYFHTATGYLGIEAASLFELKELLPTLPAETLLYHSGRGDFAAWARTTLGDDLLAAELDKISHRDLDGEALREALLHRVSERYGQMYEDR
jgi:hydroxymethylpyrimidine pyrophosphatase-like HAD family hydrolase